MAIITTILNKVPRPWLIKLSYWVRPFLSFYLRGKKYQEAAKKVEEQHSVDK